MAKTCCVCKKSIDNGDGFLTTLTDEVFAHGACFMGLLPIPSDDLSLTRDQKQAERKIAVDKIAQKLIEDYQASK